jgi:hypothetical protein
MVVSIITIQPLARVSQWITISLSFVALVRSIAGGGHLDLWARILG